MMTLIAVMLFLGINAMITLGIVVHFQTKRINLLQRAFKEHREAYYKNLENEVRLRCLMAAELNRLSLITKEHYV